MAGTESSKAKERRRRRSPKSEISTLDQTIATLHNVHFVKYDVTVSFMAQVLDTVAYFVSHVLVVDTVTYFDIFR